VDAIQLPPGLTLPSAFGAPAAPLQTGQVIQALVLELIEADIFRLQLPQATIDVRASVPLTPGSTITLAVKGNGPGARLAIYTDVPSVPPAVRGPAPASNLAGRTPIGEAIVIARTPLGQGAPINRQAAASNTNSKPVPAQLAPDPAVLREAPVDTPTATSAAAVRLPDMPIRIVTPAQAVTQATQTAAPRQAGLGPLFADVAKIAQAAEEGASPVPAPVRKAVADVVSLRVPLDARLSAGDIKQAFLRSGILFEPKLAAAATPLRSDSNLPGAPSPEAGARPAHPTIPADAETTPTPRDDLKAALLVLRQVLKGWMPTEPAASRPAPLPLGAAAPELRGATTPAASLPAVPQSIRDVQAIRQIVSALAALPEEMSPVSALAASPMSADEATDLAKTVASVLTASDAAPARQAANLSGVTSALPPPYRGAPLVAQPMAAPTITTDAPPHEIAEKLIAETDSALARTTLLQVASLPGQPDQPRTDPTQRWNFEVPFATPQGTAIAQFDVSRDGRAVYADQQARTWRARFSVDIEPTGPVHALIALTGTRTCVTVWAERASTAARLNDNAAMLSEALRAAELEPADFSARVGAPPLARQATPGRFMDRAS